MVSVLVLSFILVLWWVGVWGLCETAISAYAKGNAVKQCIAYGTLIIVVLGYILVNPEVIERFA